MPGSTPRTEPSTTPSPPPPRIAAGNNHTCGLPGDGTEECWGDNYRGQLGHADFEPHQVAGLP